MLKLLEFTLQNLKEKRNKLKKEEEQRCGQKCPN
jgi:hypothetical protein